MNYLLKELKILTLFTITSKQGQFRFFFPILCFQINRPVYITLSPNHQSLMVNTSLSPSLFLIKDQKALVKGPYKLFSSIINSRLQKVIDKVIHPSQKAYSEVSVIQENILQVFENLSKANHISCPLTSLLIDFSKAFDSISHSYISKVLEHFNFGPRQS